MNYLLWRKGQTVMYEDEYNAMKRVFVTVEPRDGSPLHIDLWRGRTVASIRRLAEQRYKDCDIQFGNWF